MKLHNKLLYGHSSSTLVRIWTKKHKAETFVCMKQRFWNGTECSMKYVDILARMTRYVVKGAVSDFGESLSLFSFCKFTALARLRTRNLLHGKSAALTTRPKPRSCNANTFLKVWTRDFYKLTLLLGAVRTIFCCFQFTEPGLHTQKRQFTDGKEIFSDFFLQNVYFFRIIIELIPPLMSVFELFSVVFPWKFLKVLKCPLSSTRYVEESLNAPFERPYHFW